MFAVYVVGTLIALLGFGHLSDHIGRKQVMAGAIVLAAVSTAIFLAATSIGVVIVARIISGLAARRSGPSPVIGRPDDAITAAIIAAASQTPGAASWRAQTG